MENNEFDFKVVKFKNISDFDFTPVLGAMFNSRPIFGKTKAGCIEIGEELNFPYHIGRRLAINLAKQMLVKKIPEPVYGTGDPAQHNSKLAFGDEDINKLVAQIFVGEYQEEKPIKESETDVLMRKFEELNRQVEALKAEKVTPEGFKDKQEVIAELEKKGIVHDKRKNKAELEKLLA
jgi:predicted dienelactone hydrolase